MYWKFVLLCTLLSVYNIFAFAVPNVLETEQSSFFGFTHDVRISSSTMELVEELEDAVWEHSTGDRQARRYFDTYDTPFFGQGRRNINFNYD